MQQQRVLGHTNEDIVDLLYQELKQERAARARLQYQLWQLNKAAAVASATTLASGVAPASSTQPLTTDAIKAELPRAAAVQHDDHPEQPLRTGREQYAAAPDFAAAQYVGASQQQHQNTYSGHQLPQQHSGRQQLPPTPFGSYSQPLLQLQQQQQHQRRKPAYGHSPTTAAAATIVVPAGQHMLNPSHLAAPCVRPATPANLRVHQPPADTSTTSLTSPTFGIGSSSSSSAAAATAVTAAARLLPGEKADMLMGALAARQSNDELLFAESVFDSSSSEDSDEHHGLNPDCHDSRLHSRQHANRHLHHHTAVRHQLLEFPPDSDVHNAGCPSSSAISSVATVASSGPAAAGLLAARQQQQQQQSMQQAPNMQCSRAAQQQVQQQRQHWDQYGVSHPSLSFVQQQSSFGCGSGSLLHVGATGLNNGECPQLGFNNGECAQLGFNNGECPQPGQAQLTGPGPRYSGDSKDSRSAAGALPAAAAAAAAAAVHGRPVPPRRFSCKTAGDKDTRTDSSWHSSWDEEIEALCNKLTPFHYEDDVTQTRRVSMPTTAAAAQGSIHAPCSVVCGAAFNCARCCQLEVSLTQAEFERELTAAQLAAVAEERDLLAQQQQSLLQLVVEQQMGRQ